MSYRAVVRHINEVYMSNNDGETVDVLESGSVSASGQVIPHDGDHSRFLLYLLVIAEKRYDNADQIPDLGASEARYASVVQVHGGGVWASPAITGSEPSDAGKPNQLLIWGYDLSVNQFVFKVLQNFTAKRRQQDNTAKTVVPFKTHGATISHPNGVNDDPYPVNNSGGSGTGSIEANGTATGPINTPVYLRVFNGVPYPTMLPSNPVSGCVTTSTDADGNWNATVGGAKCSGSSPFPVNQLLVWSWNASSSTYSAGSVIFRGRCT